MINILNIRNFSIIAHINHGKSTLADRFLEICKNFKLKKNESQCLDSMDLEKEKGITIKAQCLTLNYKYGNENYILNLIDTPGHIDFSFEVNRSLSVCDGVILLIDVSKGIQAQTITNYNKALDKKLKVIFVLNKIDLSVDKESLKQDIKAVFKIENFIEISAKTGYGVSDLIESIINNIPCPKVLNNKSGFSAYIFDSFFDNYSGMTCLIKVICGSISKNDKFILSFSLTSYKINNLGIFSPEKIFKDKLYSGEIGFVVFSCKNISEIKVGTYINSDNYFFENTEDSYVNVPKIYANIYPINFDKFDFLKNSFFKLALNDSSLIFSIYKSQLFGFGFKCGFLGILHLEITKERLEREYGVSVIVTPPNITFKVVDIKNKEFYISSPADLNNIKNIKNIYEQLAIINIISPVSYLGKIIQLCVDARGLKDEVVYVNDKVYIKYKIPFNEIIFNFFNKLQILTNGFASFDYILGDYVVSDLIKLDILINEKKVDALEFIVHKTKVKFFSNDLLEKIKNIIPRQLFDVKIQASVNNKIIGKVVIKAIRKNVLSKCYGGDITRKKKLLEKQKIGKKKLKRIGNVDIPSDAFIRIMDWSK